MKHVYALLIKFVMITLVLYLVLGIFTDLRFNNIFIISLAVTIFAYLIGDLLILSKSNNTTATLADIGLAFVVIYFTNYFLSTYRVSFWNSLVAALIIGAGEWFFHKYVYYKVFPDIRND